MKKNLLTVLLITYNHKDYFEKSIESVLSQKTNFDFVIKIYDDASTDGTSDLVRKYQKKYPEKIQAIIREKNIGVVDNIYNAIKDVDTPYFATLETDDYWCDDTKLQQQIDALEANPNCSICGHNNLQFYAKENKTSKPFYKRKSGIIKIADIKKYHEIKVHPSTRIFRTSCIDFNALNHKSVICCDSTSFWYFLSKGNLYYIDSVMSVYNYTEKGIYSGADKFNRQKMALKNLVNINDELDYKYNKVFLKQIKKEIKLNYFYYLRLKYFTPIKKLKRYYHKLYLSFTSKNSLIKYYMYDDVYNMGDILNKYMLEKYIPMAVQSDYKNANLLCIGSILDRLLRKKNKNKYPVHIFGSGFIKPSKGKEKLVRPVILHAVRGINTQKRFEKLLNKSLDGIVLGDPGLLANKIIDISNIEKKYDVGIIPHHSEGLPSYLKNIQLKNLSSTLIDVSEPLMETLEKIAQCKVIISSAMHGLIIADSFNIPNHRLIFSDKIIGGDYKFEDYYSAYGLPCQPSIDLRVEKITDKTIDKIKKEYKITPVMVENINEKLLQVLPKDSDFKE